MRLPTAALRLLWKSDGSAAGTLRGRESSAINPSQFVVIKQKLFFVPESTAGNGVLHIVEREQNP